jgi:hypothetical protein
VTKTVQLRIFIGIGFALAAIAAAATHHWLHI